MNVRNGSISARWRRQPGSLFPRPRSAQARSVADRQTCELREAPFRVAPKNRWSCLQTHNLAFLLNRSRAASATRWCSVGHPQPNLTVRRPGLLHRAIPLTDATTTPRQPEPPLPNPWLKAERIAFRITAVLTAIAGVLWIWRGFLFGVNHAAITPWTYHRSSATEFRPRRYGSVPELAGQLRCHRRSWAARRDTGTEWLHGNVCRVQIPGRRRTAKPPRST